MFIFDDEKKNVGRHCGLIRNEFAPNPRKYVLNCFQKNVFHTSRLFESHHWISVTVLKMMYPQLERFHSLLSG